MTDTAQPVPIVEQGARLMASSALRLVCGQPVDVEAWAAMRRAYGDVRRAWFRRESPAVRALGELSHVMLATSDAEARAAATCIPEGEAAAPARALAETVIARRAVDREPLVAARHRELANGLYALLPMVPGLPGYIAAHRTMIRCLLRFFECCSADDEIRSALAAASELTGGASQLAWKAGISSELDAAATWGERVLALNPQPQGMAAVGVWVIASNLQNIHAWWARDDPAAAVSSDEHRARLGALAESALAAAGPAASVDMRTRTLRGLAAVHARLAAMHPAQREEHARLARLASAAYASLCVDDVARQEATQVAAQLERELSPGADPPVPDSPKRAFEEAGEVMDRFESEASALVQAVVAEPDATLRRRRLERALDDTFAALAEELGAVLRDAALDYDVCKALIVLGACADGRLDPNLVMLARRWAWAFGDGDVVPRPRSRDWRQYFSVSGPSDAARTRLWGRLVGLACTTETLQAQAGLRIGHLLRPRLSTLLKRVLAEWQAAQRAHEPMSSAEEDDAALMACCSAEAVDELHVAPRPRPIAANVIGVNPSAHRQAPD